MEKYDRNKFKHWTKHDTDAGRMDSRQRCMYDACLTDDKGNKYCEVVEGRVTKFIIVCSYTGMVLRDQNKIDVDHVIPLKAAWLRGADTWTAEKREAFANDPLNLLAVLYSSNRQKSANGLFNWIPANIHNGEQYLNQMREVAEKYSIEIQPQDKAAYDFLLAKLHRHRNGIKLNKVREWFSTHFGRTYK